MECKKCSSSFEITEKDREFYEKMKVPYPTLCPQCRLRRKLVWRNEMNLYKRTCDLCSKKMISIYKEGSPYKAYCLDCWWSDKWDPLEYGRDYDFNRPFFEQFQELQNEVPHMTLLQVQNDNSEYTNYVSNLKDCYLLFSADFNRDCFFGTWVERSKNCVDNFSIDFSELAYECVFSVHLYNSIFVYCSSNCSDSAFLFDCKGCQNCFMCSGLRNKSFCIENEQYSEEEYHDKIAQYSLSSHESLENLKKKFFDGVKNSVHLYMRRNGRIVNSTGDFLTNVENCENCYGLIDSKDCKNVLSGFDLKDTYDSTYVNGERGYENCECVPMPFNSAFNVNSYTGSDLQYTDSCMTSCRNLFGCVSLKHKQNCILNKQYSEQEYRVLRKKIIEHMESTGEYGQFFPEEISPFDYADTLAEEYFPQNEAKIAQNVEESVIPDSLNNVDDSILQQVIKCKDCGIDYKIIKEELRFYKKMGLPIPRKCFKCRHKERMKFRNPVKLFDRKCDKCGVDLQSTYSPGCSEKVYCEECYLDYIG